MESSVDTGFPSTDSVAFRRCLAQFATGVTVITTCVDDTLAAMTSNSFASVSLDPPLVLWSMKRASQSRPVFERATHFAVNVLASDQVDLAQNFSRSGVDKFNGVSWSSGIGGSPVLEGVAASLECRHRTFHDGGDHLIMLGDVERYCRYDRQPLLFAQGRYAMVTDYPERNVAALGEIASDSPADNLVTSQLLRAYGTMTNYMELVRKRGGLTLAESILLRAIRSMPGRTLDELLPEMLLAFNAGSSVLNQMVSRNFVTVDDDGKLALSSEGHERINAIIQGSWEVEQEVFKKIPAADIAAARRVLKAVID